MSQLSNLLKDLKYDQSPYYRDSEAKFEPETAHIFRAARQVGKPGVWGVHGIYVFQTSLESELEKPMLPARPVVYIANAETESQARKIHRSLWNLGYTPFLIVVLPHQIRIYTGFDYSEQNEERGRLGEPGLSIEQTRDLLRLYFSAAAIDQGRIWKSEFGKSLKAEQRVDRRLLGNLKNLSGVLVGRNGNRGNGNPLQKKAAHALIGKYLYIYYLRHRNILSDKWLQQENIAIDTVLGRTATVKGLRKLDKALRRRFFDKEGDIFPLDFSSLGDEHVELVAGVFNGDEMTVDGCAQMHLDFQAYRFEYIPIELLSSIYEQFLHEQDVEKSQGAIYTPEFLADYLLSEMHSVKPLAANMRILDPACGSGIFLVLAFRRFIEREIRSRGGKAKLLPQELRSILEKSIFGVERQLDACYLSEFSLILTLLSYVDPPDLDQNGDFQFPTLHNKNIFDCDFFDDESSFWKTQLKFDWIVGNPPWVKANPTDQAKAHEWIVANEDTRPVAEKRVVEAFSWRVGDLLMPDGIVGLIHHATSLISVGHHDSSKKYRSHFFKAHTVFRVTNFANLRHVLFYGNVNQPAATLVYRPSSETQAKPHIVHYGPFSINQSLVNPNLGSDGKLWTITVNENEITTVSPYEAESGEAWLWKYALWGTPRDRRAIERLRRLFPTTLEEFCGSRGWGTNLPQPGVELLQRPNARNPLKKLSYRPELAQYKVVDKRLVNSLMNRFSMPEHGLVNNAKCYVRRGKERLDVISQAPHIVLSGAWTYFIYSDDGFIIKDRSQYGIGANWDKRGLSEADKTYLRALAIYLSSSLVEYYMFFQSPEWAVSGLYKQSRRVTIGATRSIPTPDFAFEQAQELARLQKQIADEERQGLSSYARRVLRARQPSRLGISFSQTNLSRAERRRVAEHLSELQAVSRKRIDSKIFDILRIPEDIATLATEFVYTRLRLDGRPSTLEDVTGAPNREQLSAYAHRLRQELDDFVMGYSYHKITVQDFKSLVRCIVEIKKVDSPIPIVIEDHRANDLLGIQNSLRERFSQWVYVQRGLRVIEGSSVQIYKSPRIIDWTRTQAMLDAKDIIGEALST